MTFRELFKQQKGYDVITNNPFSVPCPHKFGYENKNPEICRRMLDCKSCWEREMPNAEPVNNDSVNHPSHYTKGGIECIDCIESVISSVSDPVQAFLVGQVVKYLYRYTMKNGLEDLRKAQWYLNRLVAKVGKK